MAVAKEIYHAMDDPKMQKMVIDTQEKRERELSDGTKIPFLYIHGTGRGSCLSEEDRRG